ncbi:MAG: orotate phosphoribosyltransferase, partial [Chloroflexi bacterium]|nr:orotate phosphoribosyltransferase [Chloroflexota bacterium]
STGGSVSRVIGLVRAAGALPLGASVIADRTGGRLDLGLPLRALVTLDIPSWSPAECPLCRAGAPLVQPKD